MYTPGAEDPRLQQATPLYVVSIYLSIWCFSFVILFVSL